jgi:di/tripeptidase
MIEFKEHEKEALSDFFSLNSFINKHGDEPFCETGEYNGFIMNESITDDREETSFFFAGLWDFINEKGFNERLQKDQEEYKKVWKKYEVSHFL